MFYFCNIFLVYGFLFTNWIYSIFIGIIFLLWIILAYFFTYRNRLPDCEISLCVVAFVMSIFWIWFISEILVDVLKLFGVLLNVPESFLAMTLLAFGNSAPGKIINMKTTLFKNKTLYLRYPYIYIF